MLIAGGLYRELCEIPRWDTTLGSGGRAAKALAALGTQASLYTYASMSESYITENLRNDGIATFVTPRPTPIAFAYFHPLSTPHIQPKPEELNHCAPLRLEGEKILRFGLLEGDAIVKADWAVYDPQTFRNPKNFHENGSTANHLGIVLNEDELISLSGHSDIQEAAHKIFSNAHTDAIVVKMGIRGALVIKPDKKMVRIPAYKTSKVFKIGSGDVFTAAFFYFWAEQKYDAVEAASEASRLTAIYCTTKCFEFNENLTSNHLPILVNESKTIWIIGSADSLGQRYLFEEARYSLAQLGMNVYVPGLDTSTGVPVCNATLVIDDDIDQTTIDNHYKSCPASMVRLTGRENHSTLTHRNIIKTDDFTTALYWVCWATNKR